MVKRASLWHSSLITHAQWHHIAILSIDLTVKQIKNGRRFNATAGPKGFENAFCVFRNIREINQSFI